MIESFLIFGIGIVAGGCIGIGIALRWAEDETAGIRNIANFNAQAAIQAQEERDNWRALYNEKATELRDLKSVQFDEAKTTISPLPIDKRA